MAALTLAAACSSDGGDGDDDGASPQQPGEPSAEQPADPGPEQPGDPAPEPAEPETDDEGYQVIFDGTAESLAGWRQAPEGEFELQPDGSLLSRGGMGMLWYEAEEFTDFSLTLQFRDVSQGETYANSGVFVRFPDPTAEEQPECGQGQSAAWVAISCGHEIQLYDGPSGEPQKTGSVYNFDPLDLDDAAATDTGVWNDFEIRVVGQTYTILRNGEVINEFDNSPGQESSRDGDPPTGQRQFDSAYIGLQNHGDNDLMEFADIRVRDLS